MGADSKIEWTTHTFNPVRGCTKVSPGCTNCYAETLSHRNPKTLGVWGDKGTRVVASEAMWREPLKWDKAAHDAVYRYTLEERQAGKHLLTRPRVFCASLADVFEDREEWVAPRVRLFKLIDATPWLDWLLVTKRPENIDRLWPAHSEDVLSRDADGELYQIHIETRTNCDGAEGDCCWGSGWLPPMPWPIPSDRYRQNVWLGTSVEDQAAADLRLPHLLRTTRLAPILFLSMEPLLSDVNLDPWLWSPGGMIDTPDGRECYDPEPCPQLDWVIVGGESGPKARPMHPDWARSIRDQCVAAGVSFHFKQWGEWLPLSQEMDALAVGSGAAYGKPHRALFPDGRHLPDLTGRGSNGTGSIVIARVGKKAAGRMLDGRTWDELPTPEATR